MILSAHAIFGAAVASLVPSHPVAGFALGFVSHFVLDAIPHTKEYKLLSVDKNSAESPELIKDLSVKFKLLRDMFLVSADALVGLCLAFLSFFNPVHPFIFLLGAVASLLPDFFTFLYLILKHRPLGLLYDFHVKLVHSKIIPGVSPVVGLALQFFTVAVLTAILFGVKYYLS